MLLTRQLQVRQDQLWAAMQAAHQLAHDCEHIADAAARDSHRQRLRELGMDSDDDMDSHGEPLLAEHSLPGAWQSSDGPLPAPLSAEERTRLSSFLLGAVKVHVQVPTALAMGHMDLPSKVDATLHACSLETASLGDLQSMMDTTRSYTTDMGVEVGIADFRCQNLKSLLPNWHPARCRQQFLDDTGEEDPYVPASPFLLRHCLGIAGMNHIVSNLAKDIDEALPGWSSFYSQVKNIASMLADSQRRKRLWHTCVKASGPGSAQMEKSFMADVPKLYEKKMEHGGTVPDSHKVNDSRLEEHMVAGKVRARTRARARQWLWRAFLGRGIRCVVVFELLHGVH